MASIKLPKIFLDSGDPEETRRAKGIIGFLDGQTTNPSLIAKHPDVQKSGKKMSEKDLLDFYKKVVGEIQVQIAGPISVEVYSDWSTTADAMLKQASDMVTWGRNIYIKFPTTQEGVKAAHKFVATGGRVNMTLIFNQTQAAAAYAATLESKNHPHFASPFIGRWNDRGVTGLDLLKNILKMYRHFDHVRKTNLRHIHVLASSIRTLDHFYGSVFLGADMMTVPIGVLREWVQEEKWVPGGSYRVEAGGLKSLIYEDLPWKSNFEDYTIEKIDGDLLDEGLKKFSQDWKKLLI